MTDISKIDTDRVNGGSGMIFVDANSDITVSGGVWSTAYIIFYPLYDSTPIPFIIKY